MSFLFFLIIGYEPGMLREIDNAKPTVILIFYLRSDIITGLPTGD